MNKTTSYGFICADTVVWLIFQFLIVLIPERLSSMLKELKYTRNYANTEFLFIKICEYD